MSAILMTGGSMERKILDVFHGTSATATSRLGVTAPAGEVVLFTFEGTPLNRVQERLTVTREIVVTLPDLVEMHANISRLIDEAIERGALVLP